ncbi:MAG: NERD domain-containing protein [Chloroflexota bacterium]|nr:NERD domain-containing protein [Chloroflexota bacterium]
MFGADARGRLAEKVAAHLREQLPEGYLVLARYAPRDGNDRVPVVIIGAGVFVIEPRDEEGDFVCYQDHWYRGEGVVAHSLSDAPSLRARDNAARVKRDLGTGGFITVKVEPLVVLTRGRPSNVRSSCVPVIAGLDPLVRHIAQRAVTPPSPEQARALANALDHPIKLALS